MPKTTLTAVDLNVPEADLLKINPKTGMQHAYIILSEEERAKGFVRPLRDNYVHKGIRPKYPLRDLTEEEKQKYAGLNYIKYEIYSEEKAPLVGRYWTDEQLNSGCGHTTTMGYAIAATYARDPSFYGSTFCCHCGKHYPLEQFVWFQTDEVVGS